MQDLKATLTKRQPSGETRESPEIFFILCSGLRLGGESDCFLGGDIYLVEGLDRIWAVGFGERP